MQLFEFNNKYILINYPIVDYGSTNNTGGHEHLIANIDVYRRLGYRVICICRFSLKLIHLEDGLIVLNIIPGRSNSDKNPVSGSRCESRKFIKYLISVRYFLFNRIVCLLIFFFKPCIFHQRANLRFLKKENFSKIINLIELNDEYVPKNISCDGYLTVTHRPNILDIRQMVYPWPVIQNKKLQKKIFFQKLNNIFSQKKPLNIILYGVGGIGNSYTSICEFISTHPWFLNKEYVLHIYGVKRALVISDTLKFYEWTPEELIPNEEMDAGLIYYDSSTYTDERLCMGSPTKLSKYVDWSLPIFSNRSAISNYFLGGYDNKTEVLAGGKMAHLFYEHLSSLRDVTLVKTYANHLLDFIELIKK